MTTNTDRSETEKYVDDTAIIAKIKVKYIADDLIKAFDITVDAKDNIVTLSGKVSNVATANQAIEIAKNTSGVKEVISHLNIDNTTDANTKQNKYEYL